MKIKIIFILAVLLSGGPGATPNSNCDDARCNSKAAKQGMATPAKTVVLMIDDLELLPIHHFLNNF